MASEVQNDLGIELSDLNYLCSHASLACKGFLEMIETDKRPIMIHRPACFAAGKNDIDLQIIMELIKERKGKNRHRPPKRHRALMNEPLFHWLNHPVQAGTFFHICRSCDCNCVHCTLRGLNCWSCSSSETSIRMT